MSTLHRNLALAFIIAALCPGAQMAHAQATAVPYWMADMPIGFGGILSSDENADGTFRYKFSNGLFIGGGRSDYSLGTYGFNHAAAFSGLGSLSYEGMKFGYDFKNAPLSIYGGLNTMKYDVGPGAGSPFAAFENSSSTVQGYNLNTGVEFRPTSNLSLSVGVGYTDMSGAGRVDSDIRSPLLPGQTPQFMGGRRY